MASPARHAFAPLSAFIEASSISRSVQTRATTLYSSARSKTGLGSGNELPGNVAGNANAIAAGEWSAFEHAQRAKRVQRAGTGWDSCEKRHILMCSVQCISACLMLAQME